MRLVTARRDILADINRAIDAAFRDGLAVTEIHLTESEVQQLCDRIDILFERGKPMLFRGIPIKVENE